MTAVVYPTVEDRPLKLNLPGIVEAREFTAGAEYGVPAVLEACLQKGYRPLFMPEIVQARIAATGIDDRAWSCWWITQSVKATGRGKPSSVSQKGGTAVVVYAHVPNYFSLPGNVRTAISRGLQFGHGEMPQEEFQRFLDMEDGESAIVVDSATMRRWPSGYYGIGEPTKEHMDNFGGKINGKDMIAINHPATKPFLGPGNAQRYLEAHKKLLAGGHVINIMESDNFLGIVNVRDRPDLEGYPEVQGGLGKYRRIPVWDPNSMRDDGMPLGRLLSIADYFDCGYNSCFEDRAHLAGVR